MKYDLVVTRHTSLVQYMREMGYIDSSTPVCSHPKGKDVRGKRLIGVLPNSLAYLAESITEVPLKLEPKHRGRELTIAELREVALPIATYKVVLVNGWGKE